jgi:glyoxylase-like metal-dependent hydrolase (beta-lactamase superfamily II)/8-oxo-dGTP pyrophosphatase MutT (NUDIX family)
LILLCLNDAPQCRKKAAHDRYQRHITKTISMNANPQNVQPSATPFDAAAVVLLRRPDNPEVFWVKRSHVLKFLGGFHAFPGGRLDASDYLVPDEQAAALRTCAIREVFEETGLLLAEGAHLLSAEKRRALRLALINDEIRFADLLAQHELALNYERFVELPTWCTPAPAPRRFNTRFFATWVEEDQEVEIITGELAAGEWLSPREALQRWSSGEALIVTPILTTMQALAESAYDFAERMHAVTQATREFWEQRVEIRQGFFITPLRTPTIPPATHTNCYFVGGEEMVIIDPGSPYADEQARLNVIVEAFLAEGRRMREIIITHLHPDHIGGVQALVERFNLPVAAHRLTAEAMQGEIPVHRLIEDNELMVLRNERDALTWRLRALWTPGHARGHLSLHEERTGTLITGDCVVGFGTVVIAPPEGNMTDYFASLRRYLALDKLTALLPGHGPIIADARAKIEKYITHRLAREAKIIEALQASPLTIPAIVKQVYTDAAPAMHQLAELSVRAHLEKLQAEGRVQQREASYRLV